MSRRLTPADSLTKTCRECSVEKPASEFYCAKVGLGGGLVLRPDCIICTKRIRAANYAKAQVIHARTQHAKTKTCRSCGSIKSISGFTIKAATNDGEPIYNLDCLACQALVKASKDIIDPASRATRLAKKKALHELNAAQEREYRFQNRHKQPGYNATYGQRHPGVIQDNQRRSKKKNRHKARLVEAKYRKTNPDYNRLKVNRRRATKLNAPGSHTAHDLIDIRNAQGDRCGACGVNLLGKGTIDHRIPLSRGGSNDPSNLKFLCLPCNTSKGTRDETEFMRSRGFAA